MAGIPIGQLVESEQNIVAQTLTGIPLAQYNKRSDQTCTMAGIPICQGNILASFLFPKPHKA